MNVRWLVLCVLAASATAPRAQDTNAYVGTWRAEFKTSAGAMREGKVVISEKSGSWDMALQNRGNPCVGRAYPISIISATADELSFSIDRAKTLAGCPDGLAKLKKVDDKTLEGEFDQTRFKLVRQ